MIQVSSAKLASKTSFFPRAGLFAIPNSARKSNTQQEHTLTNIGWWFLNFLAWPTCSMHYNNIANMAPAAIFHKIKLLKKIWNWKQHKTVKVELKPNNLECHFAFRYGNPAKGINGMSNRICLNGGLSALRWNRSSISEPASLNLASAGVAGNKQAQSNFLRTLPPKVSDFFQSHFLVSSAGIWTNLKFLHRTGCLPVKLQPILWLVNIASLA